ncbi:E3 ubiquitin-protein ligase Os04g0590900-like isoform X2 [Momordica charantia]|uniref:RING-type E3 ubiquitin transferase n=1 Tax=Momordica charantia TaxID=3673 RepID=A0A6J1E3I2_MOMCH|nr:E3 ubiquitin-protein ligase Os04g0590900-like isoform X2 [Momordica charantia]
MKNKNKKKKKRDTDQHYPLTSLLASPHPQPQFLFSAFNCLLYHFPHLSSFRHIFPLPTILEFKWLILCSAYLFPSVFEAFQLGCGAIFRTGNHDPNEEFEDNHNPTLHEPWHIATTGLDEALIKSITVCKYKRGDGLVEGSDCAVCLSEFQEDESLRLLPKCSHAFHLQCIDTWFKSHSNCPLCRAYIVSFSASSPFQLPPSTAVPITSEAMPETSHTTDHDAVSQDSGRSFGNDDLMQAHNCAKNSFRALSDLGNLEKRDTVIELRDGRLQQIRRSISMDHCCQNHTIIADILQLNEDGFGAIDESGSSGDVGSSKHSVGEDSKSSHRKRILHCVMSPVSMKRSFSSGRFSLTRHGREHRGIGPV